MVPEPRSKLNAYVGARGLLPNRALALPLRAVAATHEPEIEKSAAETVCSIA